MKKQYGHLAANSEEGDTSEIPGSIAQTAEFYPYVYFSLNLDGIR